MATTNQSNQHLRRAGNCDVIKNEESVLPPWTFHLSAIYRNGVINLIRPELIRKAIFIRSTHTLSNYNCSSRHICIVP